MQEQAVPAQAPLCGHVALLGSLPAQQLSPTAPQAHTGEPAWLVSHESHAPHPVPPQQVWPAAPQVHVPCSQSNPEAQEPPSQQIWPEPPQGTQTA
jgi:hypothetical protein